LRSNPNFSTLDATSSSICTSKQACKAWLHIEIPGHLSLHQPPVWNSCASALPVIAPYTILSYKSRWDQMTI
jgi:hypothetical protein